MAPSAYVLKGGSNLRFFFGSPRYSEDMDLDLSDTSVDTLRTKVMAILESGGLLTTLRTYGIERIEPPSIARAKQTETVQRFKVHLHTTAGEDLYTKVEFSRGGVDAPARAGHVSPEVLATFRLPPLIVPHYTAAAAAHQKIQAIIGRASSQARDVFDLHILRSQPETEDGLGRLDPKQLAIARERIYSIEYQEYRDTVVGFLGPEDRDHYDSHEIWDEIRLDLVSLLDRANAR